MWNCKEEKRLRSNNFARYVSLLHLFYTQRSRHVNQFLCNKVVANSVINRQYYTANVLRCIYIFRFIPFLLSLFVCFFLYFLCVLFLRCHCSGASAVFQDCQRNKNETFILLFIHFYNQFFNSVWQKSIQFTRFLRTIEFNSFSWLQFVPTHLTPTSRLQYIPWSIKLWVKQNTLHCQ